MKEKQSKRLRWHLGEISFYTTVELIILFRWYRQNASIQFPLFPFTGR